MHAWMDLGARVSFILLPLKQEDVIDPWAKVGKFAKFCLHWQLRISSLS